MAKRYWVATSGGNWQTTASWSTTSGGASGASIPNYNDDVIFDTNSITTGSSTITINSYSEVQTLDMENVTNSPTLRFQADFTIAGTTLIIPSTITTNYDTTARKTLIIPSTITTN